MLQLSDCEKPILFTRNCGNHFYTQTQGSLNVDWSLDQILTVQSFSLIMFLFLRFFLSFALNLFIYFLIPGYVSCKRPNYSSYRVLAFQRRCPGSRSGDQLTLVYGALRTFTYVLRFTAALGWCGLTMTLKLLWKYDAVF